MPQIEQVMTASEYSPEKHLPMLPFYATPKVDGVRFYVKNGRVWTRSNKPLPNKRLRLLLPTILPDGTDGELCGSLPTETDAFQKAQSIAMGVHADISGVRLYLFDWLDPTFDEAPPYSERIAALAKWWATRTQITLGDQFVHTGEMIKQAWTQLEGSTAVSIIETANFLRSRVTILSPTALRKPSHPDKFLATCLSQGFEGIMLRLPSGGYKFGRSTQDEALLLKYKPWATAEAVIIGFEELQHNENDAFESETGKTKRSSAASGKSCGGTLGSFLVQQQRPDGSRIEFSIGGGKGLTKELRQQIWNDREVYKGLTVSYRYLEIGTKDLPRMPQFIGFRAAEDR